MRRRPNEEEVARSVDALLSNLSRRIFNDERATRIRSKGRNQNKTASADSDQPRRRRSEDCIERERDFEHQHKRLCLSAHLRPSHT